MTAAITVIAVNVATLTIVILDAACVITWQWVPLTAVIITAVATFAAARWPNRAQPGKHRARREDTTA